MEDRLDWEKRVEPPGMSEEERAEVLKAQQDDLRRKMERTEENLRDAAGALWDATAKAVETLTDAIEKAEEAIQAATFETDEAAEKLEELERDARRLAREADPLPRPDASLPKQAKAYFAPKKKARPTARSYIRNIRDAKNIRDAAGDRKRGRGG